MKRVVRFFTTAYRVLRELTVIIAFYLLVLSPLLKKIGAQGEPKHSLRASVRPNDSVKANPVYPWVYEYEAPAVYEDWWKELAACEHLPHPGQLTKAVRWVSINSTSFRLGVVTQTIYGFTDADKLTIYIAEPSKLDPEIVKHEMAHQLHWWMGFDEGEDYHPPDTYENCALHRFHQ